MIERIAYNLGRNDEEPNIILATLLCNTKDFEGIKEIVEGLRNKKKEVANDCIKVLYEIGERNPELISEYVIEFIQLLKSQNNRLVWGGMTALSKIVHLKYKEVYEYIGDIKKAYENGSVITVDNAISVFAELCKADKKHGIEIFEFIIKHLGKCRPGQVCQHSERAFVCVDSKNYKEFKDVLLIRKESLTDTQKKRINKLIRKIELGQYCSI